MFHPRVRPLIAFVLALLVSLGCGKSAPPSPAAPPPAVVAPSAPAPTAAPAPALVKPEVPATVAPPTQLPPTTVSNLPSHLTVKFVKDGDSVTLSTGEDLRYIGIDTPEKGQPFSDEARALNKKLVEGKTVRVEYDEETRDGHNRVLAYVYVMVDEGGGEKAAREVFVNAEMLRQGLARVYPHEKTSRHAAEFLKIQQEVMPAKKGIWGVEKTMDVAYFVGTRNGKAYHRPDCKHMKELPAGTKTLQYTTREEAERGGKAPCRSCNP